MLTEGKSGSSCCIFKFQTKPKLTNHGDLDHEGKEFEGFFRYWNPTIKKFLGELSQAEFENESNLKSILQRLIGRFCEHHNKWRQLASTTAELDVLISLAIASDIMKVMLGACPKSHGVNVAWFAGLPDSILKKVDAKSIEFEAKYGKHNKISEDKSAQSLEDEVAIFIHELMNVASNLSCDEFSKRIDNSTLIQLHSRENMLLQQT